MRLLIVEDEWLVAQFIADVAQTQEIEIAGISQSYDDATKLIDTLDIDCTIVDINLRGAQHGIDVARYLKTKEIPFLFLTAYKDMDTIQEATDLKPLSYLIKPISEENLIAAFMIVKNHFPDHQQSAKSHPFTVANDGMIMYNGEMLLLSHYERIVLGLLIKNFRCVVSRETFFEHLWNCPDDINEGTLRNTILKLRKKLNIEIENVRNVGYIFTKYL